MYNVLIIQKIHFDICQIVANFELTSSPLVNVVELLPFVTAMFISFVVLRLMFKDINGSRLLRD